VSGDGVPEKRKRREGSNPRAYVHPSKGVELGDYLISRALEWGLFSLVVAQTGRRNGKETQEKVPVLIDHKVSVLPPERSGSNPSQSGRKPGEIRGQGGPAALDYIGAEVFEWS
jgi:hypothetical protein